MSYRSLEIWQLAREASIDVHRMTLHALPQFEFYEEGSQIRRSVKSVRSNLVEGYGRRRYKQDFVRFLTYSLASNDETTDHLETLFETGSLSEEPLFKSLITRQQHRGRKLNNFLRSVESEHRPFQVTSIQSSSF